MIFILAILLISPIFPGSVADNGDIERLTFVKTSDTIQLPSERRESGAHGEIRTPTPRATKPGPLSKSVRLQFGPSNATFVGSVASEKMPSGLGFGAKLIQVSASSLLRVAGLFNSRRSPISNRVIGLLRSYPALCSGFHLFSTSGAYDGQ